MARWQFRGRLDRQTDSRSVLATFELSAGSYGLNQLRYDLRKLKGYGLLERDGRRYAFQLTAKGIQVALLFLSFHKRLCGPLAHSRSHHKPNSAHRPDGKLEADYHQADKAIENIILRIYSVLTRALIDALRKGAGDSGNSGFVTIEQPYVGIQSEVANLAAA